MGLKAIGPVMRPRLAFVRVLRELERRHFGVLSTVTKEGRSHSVGVVYGVSRRSKPFEIYVMTRRHLKKSRNLAANPNVSMVVPLTRRLLPSVPPPCIQFQGRAEIVDYNNQVGVETFKSFLMGRQILGMYEKLSRRGETRTCFLRITPDPVIFTYMLGRSLLKVRRRMEVGVEKVKVPPEYWRQT